MKLRVTVKNVAFAGITAILLTLMILPPALAHYRVSPSRWFWEGSTFSNSRAFVRDRSDPVNVLYYDAGGNVTLEGVEDHLENEWEESPIRDHMNTWPCLGTRFTNQWMAFRAQTDRAAGQPSRIVRLHERTLSNNHRCIGNQYHTRLWDDQTHNVQTQDHLDDQWVVGGVHFDRNALPDAVHRVGEDWDVTERVWRDRMEEHCSYLRWRMHPGSRRVYGRFHSDGYLLLILWRHVDAPGSCPGRP
jgi:hypothetical protein